MASVYFDPAVGGNGTTVTDDGDPATGLANGGHRVRFVPALQQAVTVAGSIQGNANSALNSANSASASAANASASATNAATSATNAADSEISANQSSISAQNSANQAASSATSASTSAANALASQNAAATSESNAAASEAAVAADAADAAASASAAAISEANAETSELNAASSESNAASSESNAASSESNAATSASNAATSASSAAVSATNASASATAAALSESNAATSETNAASSETNAASSETNAAASAASALASKNSAETSETNAAASAASAATSEANAAASEANLATAEANSAASAAAAATSESNAATSESNAAASEAAAALSETNAANSASAALASQTAAGNSATSAATSASNAATSESNAADSETSAASSAASASTSASNAANSATSAANSATSALDSKNTAQTAATSASGSATSAQASATSASTSANSASTSATNASASASQAATSASNAATSATNAANSASSASTSATNAASSAASAFAAQVGAEAAYEEFSDRYLGPKPSDPSVDNQGQPLQVGALYYNSNTFVLRSYDGASWSNVVNTTLSTSVQNLTVEGALELNGDFIEITEGGTGATTASAARTNLDVFGKTESDNRYLAKTGGSLTGSLTVGGDLTVNGTTTTVNSVVTTVTDPVMTLGFGSDGADDNKDRGIEFEYNASGTPRVGFFGFDDSTGYFTFRPNATNTDEVFSGALGDFQGQNFRGALVGNASTASALQVPRDITLTGDVAGTVSFDGSNNVEIATTIQPNSVALGTDTTGNYVAAGAVSGNGLSGSASAEGATFTVTLNSTSLNNPDTVVYRDGSGNFNAGTISAALNGNASTASAWQTARTLSLTGDATGSVNIDGSANASINVVVQNDSHSHDTQYYTQAQSSDIFAQQVSLTGDATGSALVTGGIASVAVTVVDDSHLHDTRYYTKAQSDAQFLGITAKAADADKLDNIDSSQFLRSDVSDTLTLANLGLGAGMVIESDTSGNAETGLVLRAAANPADGSPVLVIKDAQQNPLIRTERNGFLKTSSNEIYVSVGTDGTGGFKVYHTNNDGVGSGLDADLLDGNQGSFYQNASNLNAGTVPTGRLTGSYDISITGNATTASTANLAVTAGRWTTARNITLGGDLTGSVSIDGSANVTLTAAVVDDSHTHDGRYYTETESDNLFAAKAGDTFTGNVLLSADRYVEFQGNTGGGGKLRVGGNGYTAAQAVDLASMTTTNGTLFLDSGGGKVTNINFYSGTGVAFGDGAQGTVAFMGPDGDLWKGSADNTGSVYWHAGNDGAGSTLDADLLDGQQGSFYQDASNLNTGTVPTGRLTGTYSISVTGNAGTATTLQTSRTISLTGDVTGSASFNGSANATITAVVANDSHTHDTQYLGRANNTWYTSAEGQQRFYYATNSHTYIKSGSNVYIRTANNDTDKFTFDTAGNFTATGNVTAYSDESLKTDWRPMADDFIERLAKTKSGLYRRIDTGEDQVGVSAQSLQKFLSQAVMKNEDTDLLSVVYGNAALVSCVELAKKVLELAQETVKLKAEVEKLRGQING